MYTLCDGLSRSDHMSRRRPRRPTEAVNSHAVYRTVSVACCTRRGRRFRMLHRVEGATIAGPSFGDSCCTGVAWPADRRERLLRSKRSAKVDTHRKEGDVIHFDVDIPGAPARFFTVHERARAKRGEGRVERDQP
jgi:hypothetical protein